MNITSESPVMQGIDFGGHQPLPSHGRRPYLLADGSYARRVALGLVVVPSPQAEVKPFQVRVARCVSLVDVRCIVGTT